MTEEERLYAIEMKLAFAEETIDTLNGVVAERGREMQNLSRRIEILERKVADLIEEAGDGPRPDRRPPHY